MTRDTLLISFQFILLLLVQVLVCNHIYLFDYINPYIYILFLFIHPLRKERGYFIFVSFLLGLCVDIFSNSGGINAMATVFAAYIRLPLIKIIINKPDLDYKKFRLADEPIAKTISFVTAMIFAHHFVLFFAEYLSFSNLGNILYKTLTTSVFTIILSILSLLLFSQKKN